MLIAVGALLTPILEGCGGVNGSSSGATSYAATTTNSNTTGGTPNSGSKGITQGPARGADSTNESPPTSPPFWIPLAESPQSGATGNNGVYVIPGDAISSAPVVLTPATTNATLLAVAKEAQSSRPGVAMYYATGPDNLVHIYGINLAGSANLPTVTQIGSLSLDPASGNRICRADTAQRDKSDPSTLFVVLEITNTPGPLPCGIGGTFELVNFTDSPTTAPIALPYWSLNMRNIYGPDGKLGGVVTFNASGQVVFYPADQLAGPATVVVSTAYAFGLVASSNDAVYINVTPNSSSTGQDVYKVTHSGVSSLVYTSQGSLGSATTDTNNLYLSDTRANIVSTLVQISLQTDNVQSLYTLNTSGGASVLGSTGSSLIIGYSAPNGDTTISTLPLNVSSPQPSVLASVPGTYFMSAFLDPSATYVYVNYSTTFNYTEPGTAVFAVGTGQQLQMSSHSKFMQGEGSNVILLTDVALSYDIGGATVYNFDPTAATQTPLRLADGTPYTIPQGMAWVSAFSMGDVGAINLQSATGGPVTAGAVYDASTHVIVPISPSNTSVSIW